ncbi:RNA polymerase sigma factor [Aureliella helgolandensis]|uniref:ECF RNA polymerase sigma factor SigE n=1 Tax=Aureliella helgolandensis TaxID=2527968 RepID=A0A518GAT9_9BACT|nr:sigma-70 family RNA polymerase sigma factor [Aureliella helgolandensis]QDV25724.1 ECF RNA polymerase sigma factor SigE [Aureliella helgolandensis]
MIPSPPETRASLILRLPNAADVAAWDELIEIYGPLVFRLGIRSGLQAADADDLVQEVFAAIARSVSDWLERADRGRFRAWLFRIARNTAVNQLTRRATRTWGTGGNEATQRLAEVPQSLSDLPSEFDLEYRREVFSWAAAKVRDCVSVTTWQAFWMTHVEGVSIPVAARRLGITVGTVYVARSRVMNRLQELVKQREVVE